MYYKNILIYLANEELGILQDIQSRDKEAIRSADADTVQHLVRLQELQNQVILALTECDPRPYNELREELNELSRQFKRSYVELISRFDLEAGLSPSSLNNAEWDNKNLYSWASNQQKLLSNLLRFASKLPGDPTVDAPPPDVSKKKKKGKGK